MKGNLGLVDIDSCIDVEMSEGENNAEKTRSHSKSPESETTTVPVCLSWSREVVMMVVGKKGL